MTDELERLRADNAALRAIGTPAPLRLAFIVPDGYVELANALVEAFDQASKGKGRERHAQRRPFTSQPMQHLIAVHGLGFATGQAAKKAQEAHRLPKDRAVVELLGAINYLAGAVVFLRQSEGDHHGD